MSHNIPARGPGQEYVTCLVAASLTGIKHDKNYTLHNGNQPTQNPISKLFTRKTILVSQ